jgi:hypothetical protein
MDPEQLQKMITDMLPDMEAVTAQVTESVTAKLKDLINAEVAAALASKPDPDPALDEDKPEDAPPDPEEDPALLDEEKPLEERLDSRLLDVVRHVERVTGEPADMKKSVKALLREAVTVAAIDVRADASAERLLGAVEAWKAPERSLWDTPERVENARTDKDDKSSVADMTAEEHNALIARRRAGLTK